MTTWNLAPCGRLRGCIYNDGHDGPCFARDPWITSLKPRPLESVLLNPEHKAEVASLRAEVERLRGALRVMLDGCNEGVHHGPCADCEELARAALEEKP